MRFLTTTLSLLLFSCNPTPNSPAKEQGPAPSNQTAVSVRKGPAKPEIFETAFFKNTVVLEEGLRLTFHSVDIGNINSESGALIACDPLVLNNRPAFTQHFPIGKFPVQLAVAKIDTDERVGFSRILFSKDTVVTWELALLPGQEPLPITRDDLYCYGVDAGTGLFMDAQAKKAFQKTDFSVWEKVFEKGFEKNNRNTWTYLLHEFEGHNFAAFSTGYGDGCYATYIGYNSTGDVCRLLTDFGIVQWRE